MASTILQSRNMIFHYSFKWCVCMNKVLCAQKETLICTGQYIFLRIYEDDKPEKKGTGYANKSCCKPCWWWSNLPNSPPEAHPWIGLCKHQILSEELFYILSTKIAKHWTCQDQMQNIPIGCLHLAKARDLWWQEELLSWNGM